MPNLTVKQISDKESWESFIGSRDEANFLQSWNWGTFHENLGKKIFRIGLLKKDELLGCALSIKEVAKRGTYLTIAGGPILDLKEKQRLKTLIQYIKAVALKEGSAFIRLRPQVVDTLENRKILTSLGFRLSPMHLTADLTAQLDLAKTEEELLAEMRKNTRYEIRKSQKLEINVKKSQDLKDIKEFNRHQVALARKHKFVPFSYEFLYEQFKTFASDDQATQFQHDFLKEAVPELSISCNFQGVNKPDILDSLFFE